MIIPGLEYICPLCGRELQEGEAYVATSGCAFPSTHRLFRFCDTPMHVDCLSDWQDREEYSEAYFKQRKAQYIQEGFLFVAENHDWFAGFIQPELSNPPEGMEDLVEVRIRDWPLVLYGHADDWDNFLDGGWKEFHPQISGLAAVKLEQIVSKVALKLPDTKTVVSLILNELNLDYPEGEVSPSVEKRPIVGRLVRFKDDEKQCWARVDNADPIWISVAQSGVVVKKSKLGLMGPILYKSLDLASLARLCDTLSLEVYPSVELREMRNPILALFSQMALEAKNAAGFSARIAGHV